MNDRRALEIDFFIEQGRIDEARKRIMSLLAEFPDDPSLQVQLARCHMHERDWHAAIEVCNDMIAVEPEFAHAYYIRALCGMAAEHKPASVERDFKEAVKLEPDDPDYLAYYAKFLRSESRHKEALQLVDQGLSVDPQHTDCLLAKADILTALGRVDEADEINRAVLGDDPDSGDAHCAAGWAALRSGDHKKARQHFLNALQIDPQDEEARHGLLTSIKATNVFYRMFLHYVFLCDKLGEKAWILILGIWFAQRFIRNVAESNPELAPFLWPIVGILIMLVLFSWIADTIANAALLLHPVGRHALSRMQKTGALMILFSFGCGLLLWGAYAGGFIIHWIPAAIFASMALPLAATCNEGLRRKQRLVTVVMSASVCLLGIMAAVLACVDLETADVFIAAYIIAWIAFTWLQNLVYSLVK